MNTKKIRNKTMSKVTGIIQHHLHKVIYPHIFIWVNYGCTVTAGTINPLCRDRVNLVQHSKYHGCWCPGPLRREDISIRDIDYVE